MLWILFVVVILCNLVTGQCQPHPQCATVECPPNTRCRVVSRCPTPFSCSIDAQCLDLSPSSHFSVCKIGHPLLIERRPGVVRDTHCGPRLNCPSGYYCNTRLQDSYATCCLSDPAEPTKPGRCPHNRSLDSSFCFETCQNDGDCHGTRKCCAHGCSKECLPARPN